MSTDNIPSKSAWKLNLAMLWFSQLLVMAGFSAMIPFIPLFLKDELLVTDKHDLALYITLFNFFGTMAYSIFVPIWGFLSDRFGVKPMLLRGTFVTAFIYLCMGYVSTPGMLVFLRFATAACAGTTSASQTMIARTTPDNRQGFALGLLSTAIWGGSMLGNVVGGLIIHYYNYLYAFWLCGILYFIAGFAILFTKDDGARIPLHSNPVAETQHVRLAPKWLPDFGKAIWMMVFLFFIMGIIRNIESPYIALRIENIVGKGKADYWTGIVSAVVCCGAILSGAFMGFLADKIPLRYLLIPISLGSAIALALHGIGNNLILLATARTMLFLFAGGLQPVIQKCLSGITPKRKRGSAFGSTACASCIGGMIAAWLGGVCVMFFPLNGVFFFSAILYLLTLPFFLYVIARITSSRFYHSV